MRDPEGTPRAKGSARQLDARAMRRARVDAPSAREGEAALERSRGRQGKARASGTAGDLA
jgi:hypothetical protein